LIVGGSIFNSTIVKHSFFDQADGQSEIGIGMTSAPHPITINKIECRAIIMRRKMNHQEISIITTMMNDDS
jgi:hypothetical protein